MTWLLKVFYKYVLNKQIDDFLKIYLLDDESRNGRDLE
jgi:hypothetical protein